MGQTAIDRSSDSEFTFDPTNKVVGIIDDFVNTKAALTTSLQLLPRTAKRASEYMRS